jgi:hypothetical protein
MQRTKIIATQEVTGTSAGAATSIGSATCVRLCNDSGALVTVGINTLVGAATTAFFVMPNNTVEFVEKLPTDVIWSSSGIKANKVGFTN